MDEFDDIYDEESLIKKYPKQIAVASITSDLSADVFGMLMKNFAPLSSMPDLVSNKFTELKLRLFKSKLEMFETGISLDKVKVDDFFSRISPEEGAYLTEYLVETLYTADEKEKCRLYGFIFRELVLNNISKKEAKRLFYAIQNSFIEDIEKLDLYVSTRIEMMKFQRLYLMSDCYKAAVHSEEQFFKIALLVRLILCPPGEDYYQKF